MKKSFGSLVWVALAMWSSLAASPGYSQRYLGSAPVMEMGMPVMEAPVAGVSTAGMGPGMLPTDRSGAPIYANQERYYGLNDCKGDCDDRAVGPAFGRMPTYGPILPAGMACGHPCGIGGCGSGLGCGFPLFQGFRKIWNGRNYWQGVGCSERVIDELKKSWQTCRKCDLVGQNLNGTGNSIGTGLQSGKILGSSRNSHYAPIPMNTGYAPNLPQGTPPTYFRSGSGGGGCSSCGKGITVTANSPQNGYPVQNEPMALPSNIPQQYPAAQVQYIQTPQGIQAVPVQPVSQGVYYQANYPEKNENVPGYIKAQRNAQAREGIGLNEKKPTRSAYSGRTATESNQDEKETGKWISVNQPSSKVEKTVYYQPASATTVIQPVASAEVIPTPPARVISPVPSGNMVESAPPTVVYAEAPPMAYAAPPATGGVPYETGCGPVCGPMGGPFCAPVGCAPMAGPFCGPVGCGAPGIVPGAVRLTGRVAYGAGQVVAGAGRVVAFGTESAVYGTGAVVVGAGKVAVGATRAVLMAGCAVLRNVRNAGIVFVSGPCGPIGSVPGTPVPPCYSPYLTGVPYAGMGASTPAATSGEIDPLYRENESYLQMDLSQYRPNSTVSTGTGQNVTAVAQAAPQTATIGLLSTQTQRVVMADGTEVILEHASSPQSMASANFATSISPVSQFSGNQTASIPVAREDYPIVAAENPKIELAPGEVLVSQQDFILAPPENAPVPSQEDSISVPEAGMENKTVQHAEQPFRTVSYAKPVVSRENVAPYATPVTYQRPAEPSFLKLKAATPIHRQ